VAFAQLSHPQTVALGAVGTDWVIKIDSWFTVFDQNDCGAFAIVLTGGARLEVLHPLQVVQEARRRLWCQVVYSVRQIDARHRHSFGVLIGLALRVC